MMKSVKNLKIDDILNSEGTVLGLHKYGDQLYLSSYLKDKSGTVYYSLEEPTLMRYFHNELKLREVFLSSEDIVVPRKSKGETVYLMKEELTELITCGERLFLENPEEMRNDRLVELFES